MPTMSSESEVLSAPTEPAEPTESKAGPLVGFVALYGLILVGLFFWMFYTMMGC